ncbi:MAG: ATP-binding protein [Solirubrobacterales bacterium]|nr:ATP-binding protein [Solirubrobacterales bacterium]
MLWLSDIRLPAEGRGVQKARNLVDASGLTLPADIRDDLRLLISEVMTNAVRHGAPAAEPSGATIRVRIGLEQERVRVEVHDPGTGFEPSPRGPGSDLGSGWGVHFVDQLAHRWGSGHDAGAWVVWFELCLPRRPDVPGTMQYGQRASEGAPLGGKRSANVSADLARTA